VNKTQDETLVERAELQILTTQRARIEKKCSWSKDWSSRDIGFKQVLFDVKVVQIFTGS